MWRGAWGSEPPKEVVIESIQLCPVGSKYGKEIKSCKWETVEKGIDKAMRKKVSAKTKTIAAIKGVA